MWVRPGEQRVVGECLAAARMRAGITQRELAARPGKPQSFVSAYENGQRRVDVLEFLVIIETLSADPGALLEKVIERRSRALR